MESIFGVHERALHIRRERQDLLANNLANSDTPNFKAQDIDWRKAMQEANDSFASGRFALEMRNTDHRHIEGYGEFTTNQFLKFRMPTQPSLDGNTVESHIEKAKFMENSMQYQATLEFLNSKVNSIRGALKGE